MANIDKNFQLWYKCSATKSTEPGMIALKSVYDLAGFARYHLLKQFLRLLPNYRFDLSSRFAWSVLASTLETDLDNTKRFISDCVNEFQILEIRENFLYDPELIQDMQAWDETKKRMSERGRKGAEKTNSGKKKSLASRHKRTEDTQQASEMSAQSTAQASKKPPIKEDEIRLDNIKENEIIEDVNHGENILPINEDNKEIPLAAEMQKTWIDANNFWKHNTDTRAILQIAAEIEQYLQFVEPNKVIEPAMISNFWKNLVAFISIDRFYKDFALEPICKHLTSIIKKFKNSENANSNSIGMQLGPISQEEFRRNDG